MPLAYKIDVIAALREKGYSTYRLRKEGLISQSTLTKFRNGQMVAPECLQTLCELLDCQPGDLLEYRKTDIVDDTKSGTI